MSLILCFQFLDGAACEVLCGSCWPRPRYATWLVTCGRFVALVGFMLAFWSTVETRMRGLHAKDPLKAAMNFGLLA